MSVDTVAFIEQDHRYVLNGVRDLPSVTTILKDAGLIDDTWFTDQVRERGSYVHLACRMLDDDELAEDSIDPRLLPYLDAYRQFLALMKPEWIYIEHRVFDAVQGYAGTLDRAGLIRGEKTIVDIKTGGLYPSVGPQTAAYRRCLPQSFEWKRAALQLKDDGTFTFHALTDRSDEGIFFSALSLLQWKQRHLR